MMRFWSLLLLICPIIIAWDVEVEETVNLEMNNNEKVEAIVPEDLAKDNLDHDCWNVREISNEDDINNNPVLMRVNIRKKHKKIINKWNQAYGIPVVGIEKFTVSSMRRACYLLRYLLADNEWIRRYAIHGKMYFMGERGGFCCPPNMGNKGLSCGCGGPPNSKTPAHEAAHWYIKRAIEKAAMAGLFKLPEFTNDDAWSYTLSKKGENGMILQDYLNNSCEQDVANKAVKADGNLDHYFIYAGQDKRLALNKAGKLRDDQRAHADQRNPNLQKLMKLVWSCNNDYVMVCKDAAFAYRMGASQALKIGKADPLDPTKMICSSSHDTPELDGRGERLERADDHVDVDQKTEAERSSQKDSCLRVLGGGKGGKKFHAWLTKATGSKLKDYKCFPKCQKSGACESYPDGCGTNGLCCRKGVDTDGECGMFQKQACKKNHCCVYKGKKAETCESLECRAKALRVGVIDEAIKEGPEYYEKGMDTDENWWLQHCCAKTAKFPWANKEE